MPPNRPAPSRTPDPSRPKIWAEGSQQPPFDLAAFARVSLELTRRTVGPKLVAVGHPVADLASRMADGTFAARAARLGKAGRYLPSRGVVAAGLRGLAKVLTEAGHVVLPPPEDEPLPYAHLLRAPQATVPPPVATAPPAAVTPRRPAPRLGDRAAKPPAATPRPAVEEPTLSVIRSLIAEAERAPPARPAAPATRRAAPPPPEPDIADTPQRRPRLPAAWTQATARALHRGAAVTLGWTVTALILPYGAALAVIEHLQGEDLRHWR